MDKLVLGFTNAQTAFLTAATQGTAFAFYAVNTIVSNNIKFDGEVNFIEGKLFDDEVFTTPAATVQQFIDQQTELPLVNLSSFFKPLPNFESQTSFDDLPTDMVIHQTPEQLAAFKSVLRDNLALMGFNNAADVDAFIAKRKAFSKDGKYLANLTLDLFDVDFSWDNDNLDQAFTDEWFNFTSATLAILNDRGYSEFNDPLVLLTYEVCDSDDLFMLNFQMEFNLKKLVEAVNT